MIASVQDGVIAGAILVILFIAVASTPRWQAQVVAQGKLEGYASQVPPEQTQEIRNAPHVQWPEGQ